MAFLFSFSFPLVTEKYEKTCLNAKKNDFDQQMLCRAPVCWSKFTTTKNPNIVNFLKEQKTVVKMVGKMGQNTFWDMKYICTFEDVEADTCMYNVGGICKYVKTVAVVCGHTLFKSSSIYILLCIKVITMNSVSFFASPNCCLS